jgi:hypothetical protein
MLYDLSIGARDELPMLTGSIIFHACRKPYMYWFGDAGLLLPALTKIFYAFNKLLLVISGDFLNLTYEFLRESGTCGPRIAPLEATKHLRMHAENQNNYIYIARPAVLLRNS